MGRQWYSSSSLLPLISRSTESTRPVLLNFRSSKWLIGFTVFVAAFNDGFGYGAVVPVLPFSLVERSGVAEKDVQFWLSALLVAFGLSLTFAAPITAWGSDKLGSRQAPLLLGSALAILGTIVFCVARAPWVLVVARICQGSSNGAVYSAGLPLIADTVSADEVGSWMGFVFSGMTGGFLVAPFLAGIVYDNTGYFEVFILVLGVLAFDFILRAIIIEKKTAAKWREVDNPPCTSSPGRATNGHHDAWYINGRTRSATKDVAQNGVIIRKEPDEEPDETSPLIRRISASSSKCKAAKPNSLFARLFPKMAVLLSSPRLDVAVYGCFTYMTIVASFDACLPLFVKRTFDWKSSGVGLIFLALTAPALFGAAIGALSDRYGPKKVSLAGFGIATLSLALLALINDNTITHKVFLAMLLVFVGIGVNLILTPLAADMFYESELLEEKNRDVLGKAGAHAQVYSLLCAALGFATAVGPAWSGLIYEAVSWKIMMITLAAICVLGSVGVIFYTGGAEKKNETHDEMPDGVC